VVIIPAASLTIDENLTGKFKESIHHPITSNLKSKIQASFNKPEPTRPRSKPPLFPPVFGVLTTARPTF